MFLFLLRSHFMLFHYIFSVLVICNHSLALHLPKSCHFRKEVKILLYSPINHSSGKRSFLVSLPSDWRGCSLLLEDTREHDCFPSLGAEGHRNPKLHSKLASTRSINPLSCFTISKSVLLHRLVLHLFSWIRKHTSTIKNEFP